MVVGESKRASNIMDGIENTGDVRLHDHRLRLKQRFDIVRKLGQGTYGKVQLGINKKTGQEVAIKTIKKCKIESEADLIRIRREVQIMSSVRHPNIVHIYEVFENSEKMILVMEYCSGGELYDYLSQKKVLEEEEARRLFRQIATAVYYCHIHKICHRDLKLENVLLDDTGSAKIADFGLSNVFKETSLLSTFCGSPLYASPEIVKGTPYIGPEVDCWSLGVLLYTLVYGAMPFDGSNFKRLVRQISNGDYYEPKNPSTASPLIRDMLTVDPVKRADIAYICDNPWVNVGCESSCLEIAEALAAETPVRLDLLLSLAPAANSNSVVVPPGAEIGPEESGTDLTSFTSSAVEPSNSAEKRILELVAEGGEDAIKPSPTRTIVSAGENKRKLELAMSASGLQRKKERVASCASIAPQAPALPEETPADLPPEEPQLPAETTAQPTLKSSATMTITPAPVELAKDATKEIVKPAPKEEEAKDKTGAKPRVVVKKKTPNKVEDKATTEKVEEKQEEPKEEPKPNAVASAADKLTSLSLDKPAPPKEAPKKKFSIPGGNVGSFKEQFERRASLTTTPEVKRTLSKPVVSKIAKPKAQSEDRDLHVKTPDNGTVRLQQIGIEPSQTSIEETIGEGLKKTESEPTHGTTSVDPSALLQDARRSLQNSMARLAEEKAGEENRRRTARDIISSAIRTGKPPVPYGRSSSAGVTSLISPPGTPPATASAPAPAPAAATRVFRTEAQHRVEDHRNRGVSVERIIPIHLANEESPTSPPPQVKPPPSVATPPAPAPVAQHPRVNTTPLRRLVSSESGSASETCTSPGDPIKKSAREFIIPIAVEGKGYVTPRQRSLEPEAAAVRHTRTKPRRSLVSGGESEEEDDMHMHRLRSTRAARAESVSSGEEDEEDEGFHLLTAENLFSTLLHRVRSLTSRLNGEEGPGFPQHPHSLFNNLQSPFFNSPHLPRRHLLREGWGSRDLHADFDSMFNKSRQQMPRGNNKKTGKHQSRARQNAEPNESGLDLSDLDLSSIQLSEREMRALSGLTPALSRRLQQQLLAQLPPAAARRLRRTLSLHAAPAPAPPVTVTDPQTAPADSTDNGKLVENDVDPPVPQFSTLPRLKRHSTLSRETTPVGDAYDFTAKSSSAGRDAGNSRGSSVRSTPDRPLLSKYLTPERNLSLDESYSSDSGSILSEPSYIAAYGSPAAGPASCLGFRRHSLRLAGDQPRRRISRFLRSDFFDTPPDESLYAKHKKEKELETQKILKEIREKKNKSLDLSSAKSPSDSDDFKDESSYSRKCLSPVGILGKERSRSTTPFFPILHNIKETTLDTSILPETSFYEEFDDKKQKPCLEDNLLSKESKLTRPKSYPVKNFDSFDESSESVLSANSSNNKSDAKDKYLSKESRLIRPKSYPTSSPSPEKTYVNRTIRKEDIKPNTEVDTALSQNKNDVEVSFSITLPKKTKSSKTELIKNNDISEHNVETSNVEENKKVSDTSLVLKKYQIVSKSDIDKLDMKDQQKENGAIGNVQKVNNLSRTAFSEDPKVKDEISKKEEIKPKSTEMDGNEKKGTIKKKIIRKVSSKSKDNVTGSQETSDTKVSTEKKKVTKKVKDKVTEDGAKSTFTKKKSVLQSIGHKLEKLASTKSSSPDKVCDNNTLGQTKKENSKRLRLQREQSVPVSSDPPTESNLIKRAVTLTDVAALDSQPNISQNKTTVSKVLGLFKKFEPKEKNSKSSMEKSRSDNLDSNNETRNNHESIIECAGQDDNKPKRPTSLLLNGLGRNNKYGKSSIDGVTVTSSNSDGQKVLKKENDSKNLRNSLKLDFSRLPRVTKIVPTNSVIEPQIMNISSDDKDIDKREVLEKNGTIPDGIKIVDTADSLSHSRSRSRSTFSNSDYKSDLNINIKDKKSVSPSDNILQHPLRNHESTTPDKEDVVDRIRRKSFYSRFNEKKQRRKSTLVGPGATEYDPVARIHSQLSDPKYDTSPTSPGNYDLSPGFSIASDLSPSTERYRSLLNDLPTSTRSNLRFDNYGLNDRIDTYRSLDRNDFRKPGKSYLDYEQTPSYGTHRYSRTKSLLDSSDGSEDLVSLGNLRDPHKYNRTISMYSPGNYATYRPKRTRNSAIILKESEKEPSPENILDKIRQRKKISISVTRKPDIEKESLLRSNVSPKGEGDGAECSEKVD